jgi:hypothetical protein
MKRRTNVSTVLAILLMLVSTAGSDVSRAQRANGAAKLMVSVTVPSICTVAVTPGQLSASEAIDVRCRNLPASHPQPVVTEATAGDGGVIDRTQPGILETMAAAAGSIEGGSPIDFVATHARVHMVVINF